MSIVDVFVQPDVALLGFDTEGMFADGRRVNGCKAILLPHIDAAVAFRGLDMVFGYATPSITCFHGTFDALADSMTTIIRGATDMAVPQVSLLGRTEADARNSQFVLVGYSERQGQMIAVTYTGSAGSDVIEQGTTREQVISPFFGRDEIAKLNIVADREGMTVLAMDQCRLGREKGEWFIGGGRFYITEIRRGRMTTELIAEFPSTETPTAAAQRITE